MKMQRWLELMQLILTDMREESKNCGVLEFVTSPVQVMPLEPSLFFGHGGWAVSFVRKQTVIWKRKLMRWKRLFLLLPEWADRYNYFVELGESLPAMPVAFQVPENRIACNPMLYFYVCHTKTFAIYLLLPMPWYLLGWPLCFLTSATGYHGRTSGIICRIYLLS